MSRSAAFLVLPTRDAAGSAAASRLTQCVEDLRLAERVEHALGAAGYGPLGDIDVEVQGLRVTLAGRVPSYYLKQVAQMAALSVPGVLRVHNKVAVG